MKENICENAAVCPIFNGILLNREATSKSYRTQFCESKWQECKRYQTKKQFGKCPSEILPNSGLTLEQIKEKYEL